MYWVERSGSGTLSGSLINVHKYFRHCKPLIYFDFDSSSLLIDGFCLRLLVVASFLVLRLIPMNQLVNYHQQKWNFRNQESGYVAALNGVDIVSFCDV